MSGLIVSTLLLWPGAVPETPRDELKTLLQEYEKNKAASASEKYTILRSIGAIKTDKRWTAKA